MLYDIQNSENREIKMKIPRTGRIGRFAKIIEKEVDQEALQRIMQDSDIYESFKPDKKAAWWKSAVERLEKEVGERESIKIMQACGRKCCSEGHRKIAKRLMSESNSIQEFLEKVNKYRVKEGEIDYKLKDEKTIIGHFYRCFCGQVKQAKTPFQNRIYCHCSAEFHKQFFEAALGKKVKVEILQTIIIGAKSCEFIIHINN